MGQSGPARKCEKYCALQNDQSATKEGDRFNKQLKMEGLWEK